MLKKGLLMGAHALVGCGAAYVGGFFFSWGSSDYWYSHWSRRLKSNLKKN